MKKVIMPSQSFVLGLLVVIAEKTPTLDGDCPLPTVGFPVASAKEYSPQVDRAGFVWGREYRLAGYYTCILLWLAFGLWLLALLLLGLAPELFSRAALWSVCGREGKSAVSLHKFVL